MLATGKADITDVASDVNTDIGSSTGGPSSLTIYNVGASTCYIGDENVTDLTGANPGFQVDAGGVFSDDNIGPNDCWAVCASGQSTTLSWIYTRNG